MAGACPHCDVSALAPTGDDGVVRCDACGRSSLVGPVVTPRVPLRRRPTRTGGRRAPGEVASWPAALAALVSTVFFYAVLGAAPGSRLREIFLERGWVPYVITAVSAWALLLLAARWWRLRREAALFERDLIATGASGGIVPEQTEQTIAVLSERALGWEESFLVGRLVRALRHFESRRRVVEVVEFLSVESNADAARVDASYALVRVFVWAVPTLGFIGTVLGIGAAVGGFSETLGAAASLEAMKASIGSVTGGLGVAFDTTLLALVMSILIMFPASAVQRREESLLGEVDDYCAEVLVRRLRDGADEAVETSLVEALARRIAAELRAGHD